MVTKTFFRSLASPYIHCIFLALHSCQNLISQNIILSIIQNLFHAFAQYTFRDMKTGMATINSSNPLAKRELNQNNIEAYRNNLLHNLTTTQTRKWISVATNMLKSRDSHEESKHQHTPTQSHATHCIAYFGVYVLCLLFLCPCYISVVNVQHPFTFVSPYLFSTFSLNALLISIQRLFLLSSFPSGVFYVSFLLGYFHVLSIPSTWMKHGWKAIWTFYFTSYSFRATLATLSINVRSNSYKTLHHSTKLFLITPRFAFTSTKITYVTERTITTVQSASVDLLPAALPM